MCRQALCVERAFCFFLEKRRFLTDNSRHDFCVFEGAPYHLHGSAICSQNCGLRGLAKKTRVFQCVIRPTKKLDTLGLFLATFLKSVGARTIGPLKRLEFSVCFPALFRPGRRDAMRWLQIDQSDARTDGDVIAKLHPKTRRKSSSERTDISPRAPTRTVPPPNQTVRIKTLSPSRSSVERYVIILINAIQLEQIFLDESVAAGASWVRIRSSPSGRRRPSVFAV